LEEVEVIRVKVNHFFLFESLYRKKTEVIKVNISTPSESNAKKANLSAARKQRIKLPSYDDGSGGKPFHISEFLRHPSGIQAMLNTSALQDFQALDTNTYRSFPFPLCWSVLKQQNNEFIFLVYGAV
jgi:hypothetical protein